MLGGAVGRMARVGVSWTPFTGEGQPQARADPTERAFFSTASGRSGDEELKCDRPFTVVPLLGIHNSHGGRESR